MKHLSKKIFFIAILAFFVPVFFSANTNAETMRINNKNYNIPDQGFALDGKTYYPDLNWGSGNNANRGIVYRGGNCYVIERRIEGSTYRTSYTIGAKINCQHPDHLNSGGNNDNGSSSNDSDNGSSTGTSSGTGTNTGTGSGSGSGTSSSTPPPSTDSAESNKVVTDAGGSKTEDWGGSIVSLNTEADAKLAEKCAKYEPGTSEYLSSGCNNLSKTQDDRSCRYLLGLTSWDCNVGSINSEEDLKKGIWTIVVNILTDITVIATYLVIGYVIYGGYQYIFAGGEASKVEKGKKTLNQAFIGLAITMSASVILNTIRIALGANFAANCLKNSAGCATIDTADNMIIGVINWVIGISGLVAAVFVVYGGILYFTSAGDSSKLEKAKKTLIYSLIGLAIVALATAITAFMSGIIRDANKNAYINQTTIAKEVTHDQNH